MEILKRNRVNVSLTARSNKPRQTAYDYWQMCNSAGVFVPAQGGMDTPSRIISFGQGNYPFIIQHKMKIEKGGAPLLDVFGPGAGTFQRTNETLAISVS